MTHESQFSLLKERRFLPFFCTQFLGAFNDNVYKNALFIFLAFHVARDLASDSNTVINLGAALFILPFFLFSATAGQLADKYEKSRLMRRIKFLEVIVMALALAGFLTQNVPLLVAVLFLMGTQAALFGPVKYGILPQHLREQELVGGNGLVEMGTFVAILLGSVLGGILIGLGESGPVTVGIVVLSIAALGWWVSFGVPVAAATAPELRINWNPFTETWRNLRFTSGNRTVFLSMLGISWFWFYGATFLTQLPSYSKEVLHVNEHVVTLLLTVFSLGIGLGALLCERLSDRRVELGLVPFGSIGLTVFAFDLAFAHSSAVPSALMGIEEFLATPSGWRIITDLVLIGLFSGFYTVPLYALIQSRSERSHRSRVIAGNNILNALFMVLASVVAVALLHAGLSIPQLFLVTALFNAVVAIYIYSLVPEFLMRFIVWMLIHTIYRVDKMGLENIPEEGPAVLVCNHVSFVDALVLAAACRRPIRFIMDYRIFKIPILSFVFRTGRAIPIASAKDRPDILEQAYAEIERALAAGDLVCIFPEGRITDNGDIYPFKSGIERIIQRTPVPVVPLALRGLWGSFFSRRSGAAMTRLPRRFWSKIAVVAAPAVPPERVSAAGLQDTVAVLRGEWL